MILDSEALDGILVDLDGVVTDTARLHAAAWKRACDEILAARAAETGHEMEPFDIDCDYRRHVDGRPRQDGLKSFLAARGLDLPPGNPDDPPEVITLGGVSARKNAYFRELLARDGVPLYESSLVFLRRAKSMGFKIAVVSSSKNCGVILKSAGLDDLFETKVDGNDLEALGLAG